MAMGFASVAVASIVTGETVAAGSQVAQEELQRDRANALYTALTHQIRCPASRNMSIAESVEPLAADRRREIRDLIEAGLDEADIRRYVATRYGEAVLYAPRLRIATAALWLAPTFITGIAIRVWTRSVRCSVNRVSGGELPRNHVTQ